MTTRIDRGEIVEALAEAAGRLGASGTITDLAPQACRLAVEVIPGVRQAELVRLLAGPRSITLASRAAASGDGDSDRGGDSNHDRSAPDGERIELPLTCDADSLELHLSCVRELDEIGRRTARLFAAQLATAVQAVHANARADNLERALQTSRDIGVAMGIVMAHRACTRQQAFDLLRRASCASKSKLAGIAADVAETGILDFELGSLDPHTGKQLPADDLSAIRS